MERRPVLEAVAARRQADDAMHGFYGAGQTFMYYASRLGLALSDFVHSYPVPTSAADEGFARWGCHGTQSALGRSGRL